MNTLIFDETLGIKRPKDYNTFNYSDGDHNENYIYEVLKKSTDNSIFSSQLIDAIKDWPSEYHLSPERSNILRPLKIQKDFDILEVGGGCGAITRYLGETGAKIYSVEGSLRRAQCIKQRCKDLDNVEVICSNVYDLSIDKKFDIITLIGVFEYSAKYSPFENSFIGSLEYYKNLLKPNGILVIAIENQLGLKYFSGHEEDHLGSSFKGVEDKYIDKDVRTFGEEELSDLMIKSGFNDFSFLYPFPDYKLPKVIFSKEAFLDKNFNCSDLLYATEARSYSGKFNSLYDEKLVYPVLEKNNLLSNLSNSFLLVAQNSKKGKLLINPLYASYYTTNRAKKYNTETLFSKSSEGYLVSKCLLEANIEGNSLGSDILHNLEDGKYNIGNNLGFLIYQAVEKNQPKQLYQLLSLWINYLKKHGIKGIIEPNAYNTLVKPEYFDCIPSNQIIDVQEQLIYIDKEWQINTPISLSYVILRYLQEVRNFPSFKRISKSYASFANKIFLDNGFEKPSQADFINYRSTEMMIKEKIYKGSKSGPWRDSFYKVIAKKIYYKIVRSLKF